MYTFHSAMTLAGRSLMLALTAVVLMTASSYAALTINVVDETGAPIEGFRWIIEEDNTLQSEPGAHVNESIGTTIHMSHAPVLDYGESATAQAVSNLNAKFVSETTPKTAYYVSVLPYEGHQVGGAQIKEGQSTAWVVCNSFPIPTAQITIKVFEDNFPINNAPDPAEPGLENFKVLLDDTAGHQLLDVWGNEIGTTYQQDINGDFILDADGVPEVDQLGTGEILTDADGLVTIKNIAPGKYGVRIVPRLVNPDTGASESFFDGTKTVSEWQQTSTIEGSPTIDAWVKANEPPVFIEGFGTGRNHVEFGYVHPDRLGWTRDGGVGDPRVAGPDLVGQVYYNHFGAPPNLQQRVVGEPLGSCWVGINDPITDEGLYIAACTEEANGDSTYTIPDLPEGDWEIVVWDTPLQSLFNIRQITVDPTQNPDGGGTGLAGPQGRVLDPAVDLAMSDFDILSNAWFGNLSGSVFFDADADGIRDAGEVGIPEKAVNIRFREGAIYKAQPTDEVGEYEFSGVFPFFKYLVPEVDYGSLKPTGMSAFNDMGGDGSDVPPDPDGIPLPKPYHKRTTWIDDPNTPEADAPLTLAMQLFLSAYSEIHWGKQNWAQGENGGISGMVIYATTRASDDPRFEGQEDHEPGIPRVQVNLFMDADNDKTPDDLDGTPLVLPDVDMPPLGNFPGVEDIDCPGITVGGVYTDNFGRVVRDCGGQGQTGVFDYGDTVQVTYTDAFDDNQPTGCDWNGRPIPVLAGSPIRECIDNFGGWNQMVDGVFDGGYAFLTYAPGGLANGGVETWPIAPGNYIVSADEPWGYTIQKEEDKNVDFGDVYEPSPLDNILFPECVGADHVVQDYLSLQTDAAGNPVVPAGDLIAAPWAGQSRPLCDMRHVNVSNDLNAVAEFHMFTYVPKASRAVGFVNNDLGAEFDKSSPIYGEKPGAAWIPISFNDWNGNEVARVYADEWGSYNALVPSTFTNYLPTPLGLAPNMLTVNLNHPFQTVTDMQGNQTTQPDPFWDPDYSQMGWTFMYYPGRSSYLDTPILAVGSGVGFPDYGKDIYPASGTPRVKQVTNDQNLGPFLTPARTLTILSMGATDVPNPDYSAENTGVPQTVTRDYGFGAVQGTAKIVEADGTEHPLTIASWNNNTITCTLADMASYEGQLVVTRSNGVDSEYATTVYVNNTRPVRVVPDGQPTIQDAVDIANDGDIILVRPGRYEEAVIVYKDIIIQGFGAEVTEIYAYPNPLDELEDWHLKLWGLVEGGMVADLAGGMDITETRKFYTPIEMPGFMVLRADGTPVADDRRIDGFTLTGSVAGGGVQVPSFGAELVVSNNIVTGNLGANGGGVNIGKMETPSMENPNVSIVYNWIINNSSKNQGGGGVTINGGDTGTPTSGAPNYLIAHNRIAGNLSNWNGGGICHFGLSDGGLIENNTILLNEVFFGAPIGGQGGGIWISADPGALAMGNALGEGAGNVTINANKIQGNLAGSGSGGGIRIGSVNSTEEPDLLDPYTIRIYNNMIVNNVAAYDGGGISIGDAPFVEVVHNTITNNDSTATAAAAFPTVPADDQTPVVSTPQGAGVTAGAYSAAVDTLFGGLPAIPNPVIRNNIITDNESYRMNTDPALNDGAGELQFVGIDDLAMVGDPTAQLAPVNCILTDATTELGTGNLSAPGGVKSAYENMLRFGVVIDEGGNNIQARIAPLTEGGDYHITNNSKAREAGAYVNDLAAGPGARLGMDIDGEMRNITGVDLVPDIGADEIVNAAPTGSGVDPAILLLLL